MKNPSPSGPAAGRPNRLGAETSPYLRQHAFNPVDWYPWGEEALARARAEDRPILLSVGYSACHWCHVMERESFEDPQIAGLMNEHFVNIKVDREERPDLDEIYMVAVQAMTGSGGWPMTVFLTPDQRPFYGGTYFPPADRYGRPGFPKVLQAVADFYRSHRDQVDQQAARLTDALHQNTALGGPGPELSFALIEQACRAFNANFDPVHGGFGQAPKFPAAMSLGLLLRHYRRSGDAAALEMVETSLRRMAAGGIYDQLGGGFHRYSVDERWLIPHFEKMLYDNALLAGVYLEAYQLSGAADYRRVVVETLEYVLREMTQPAGGFYAAQDADSEGEEGRFFAWEPDEVRAVLGEEEARVFNSYYGVSETGNFEHGKSVLHVADAAEAVARSLGVEPETMARTLAAARPLLMAARKQRIAPGLDDKIIVSWNGLMITAMARAGQVLGEARYVAAAAAAADFILARMDGPQGLRHSWAAGQAPLAAYQDDYAALINGLVDLYEATFDRRWLREAQRLAASMVALFWDEQEGAFFFTASSAAPLILRTKSPYDNPIPSGNALAAQALLRLGELSGDPDYRHRAERVLRLFAAQMRQLPGASAQLLCALDFLLSGSWQVAVVGPEPGLLLAAARQVYLPSRVLVGVADGDDAGAAAAQLPLLAGKTQNRNRAAAFVCRDFTCSPPVETEAALRALLAGSTPPRGESG